MPKSINPLDQTRWLRLTTICSVASLALVIILGWYVFDRRADQSAGDKASTASDIDVTLLQERGAESVEVIQGDNPDVSQVVERVAKHMYLPRGQVTVATVKDADGLRAINAAVYQYAQNGHKVLFYPNGLILYDPAADKIVDVIRLLPPGAIRGSSQ